MRATEFIPESIGKIKKRYKLATKGLHKVRDKEFADRLYELNRIMMAAASTDGTFLPKIDHESWAGRFNIAAPYTKEENDMLIKAYQSVGSAYKDLNNGDVRSQELPTTNKQSIVKPFKGYKKK